MAYIVTAPLVISNKEDGSHLFLYENSQMPDYASADEIKRLLAIGLIAKADDGAPAKKPTSQSN